MLPTEKAEEYAPISYRRNRRLEYAYNFTGAEARRRAKEYNAINQHLYLVSDEEKSVGDYVVSMEHYNKGLIDSACLTTIDNAVELNAIRGKDYLKVIATTDKSLILKEGGICMPDCNCQEDCLMMQELLPQIPEAFVKDFCRS